VQVIVWAWCLYSSITCLKGSLAGFTGGRLFKGNLCALDGPRPGGLGAWGTPSF
jgi:hypothetical protein